MGKRLPDVLMTPFSRKRSCTAAYFLTVFYFRNSHILYYLPKVLH